MTREYLLRYAVDRREEDGDTMNIIAQHRGVVSAYTVDVDELDLQHLGTATRRRLRGRYGAHALDLVARAQPGELEPVPGTQTLWAELRWAAHAEGVVHRDDLLLRRVRLGLVLLNGGKAHLSRIRAMCQGELGWDDGRWEQEEASYLALVRKHYGLPDAAAIPDWHQMLAAGRKKEYR